MPTTTAKPEPAGDGEDSIIARTFGEFADSLAATRAGTASATASLDVVLASMRDFPAALPPELRRDPWGEVRRLGGDGYRRYLKESRRLREQLDALSESLLDVERRTLR